MLVGRVDFGESSQARSASYSAVEDAMARSIVRLECENEELRATVAMLEAERDLLRVKLTASARPATLEEVRDSVREKFDPEYEFGGGQDE
jgi:cell division protein FtsB